MIEFGVLSTIMELAKIERTEVLELCARCVYNITCQTDILSLKMRNIGIPNFLMSCASGTISTHLSIDGHPAQPVDTTTTNTPKKEILHDSIRISSSTTVKLFSGRGLANISFDKKMATLLCCEQGINAIISISKLNYDDSSYFASVILFNTSILPESVVFNNSVELINVLMELIVQGLLLSSQLAVASLLNFTRYPIFNEQVRNLYFLLLPFLFHSCFILISSLFHSNFILVSFSFHFCYHNLIIFLSNQLFPHHLLHCLSLHVYNCYPIFSNIFIYR